MGHARAEMRPLIAKEFAALVPRATTFFSGALGGIAASAVRDFVPFSCLLSSGDRREWIMRVAPIKFNMRYERLTAKEERMRCERGMKISDGSQILENGIWTVGGRNETDIHNMDSSY